MENLSQQQWASQIEADSEAIIIDVRTPHEIEEGYIPNAIAMDIQNAPDFMQKAQDLNPAKHYYVYCKSGGRSAQACMILESLGFANTFNLEGGFSQWEGAKTK